MLYTKVLKFFKMLMHYFGQSNSYRLLFSNQHKRYLFFLWYFLSLFKAWSGRTALKLWELCLCTAVDSLILCFKCCWSFLEIFHGEKKCAWYRFIYYLQFSQCSLIAWCFLSGVSQNLYWKVSFNKMRKFMIKHIKVLMKWKISQEVRGKIILKGFYWL